MVTRIERFAKEMQSSGAVDAWFAGCDPLVRHVSKTVNGPVLEAIAKASGHQDKECVNFFRYGAPLIGKLPCTGNGQPMEYPVHASIDSLRKQADSANAKILKDLSSDRHSSELMKQACSISQVVSLQQQRASLSL